MPFTISKRSVFPITDLHSIPKDERLQLLFSAFFALFLSPNWMPQVEELLEPEGVSAEK